VRDQPAPEVRYIGSPRVSERSERNPGNTNPQNPLTIVRGATFTNVIP